MPAKSKKQQMAAGAALASKQRETLEVVTERRFARDVQIDEQNGAAQDGQDQAQRKADKEEATLRI